MKLFDVYPLFDVTPVRARDVYVFDDQDTQYLDLYGGHAVISIGHAHPKYVESITQQLNQIGFYSNAVKNPLQLNWPKNWPKILDVKITNYFCVVRGQRPMKML